MVTSTFAHPYTVQVFALWLSFLPVAGMVALMVAALVRGDRNAPAKARIRVPVQHR